MKLQELMKNTGAAGVPDREATGVVNDSRQV